jgi:hypothetical protein
MTPWDPRGTPIGPPQSGTIADMPELPVRARLPEMYVVAGIHKPMIALDSALVDLLDDDGIRS